jgi:hypothetical protein
MIGLVLLPAYILTFSPKGNIEIPHPSLDSFIQPNFYKQQRYVHHQAPSKVKLGSDKVEGTKSSTWFMHSPAYSICSRAGSSYSQKRL